MEDAGFANVTDLTKDDQGIWRGRAVRGGMPTDVALDFQGNVFGGAGAAGSTAGNPPGTSAGRATDRTLGTDTTGANPGGNRPDGAPGNPPDTAAGRAADSALGTSATGANPGASGPAR
jgi:hypothetical protein